VLGDGISMLIASLALNESTGSLILLLLLFCGVASSTPINGACTGLRKSFMTGSSLVLHVHWKGRELLTTTERRYAIQDETRAEVV
jgi:hypothetical protein